MNRIWSWAIGLALLGGLLFGGYHIAIEQPAVQDRLFASAVSAGMKAGANNPFAEDGLHAVVCGSSSPLPAAARAKPCLFVVAGERAYIVDTGPESTENLVAWRLPMNRLAGVFLTHFHSDHIGELGELNLQSWIGGRPASLMVYGPPGVEDVVAGFTRAYQLDQTYRTAHHGREIADPERWPMLAVPLGFDTPPTVTRDRRKVVLVDGDLTVTAIEVSHSPVEPAYGYRFDYKGRSLVISGDTAKHPPLAVAASGADVLFHEAQAQHLVLAMSKAAAEAGRSGTAKILADIVDYHTSPVEAAEIANAAKAKLLVLYHLTPPPSNALVDRAFVRGVEAAREGDWIAARDGTMVSLPAGSEEIEISVLGQ